MSRITFATLSTANLAHNIQIIKQYTGKSLIMGMVKANAYGHGIRQVSLRLQNIGSVDVLGVARIDEALILREIGVKLPIVLMEGVFSKSEILIAASENFEIVFHHQHQINLLEDNIYLPKKIKAWFKIDTCMSRLGFLVNSDENREQAFIEFNRLYGNANVSRPLTVISHLACASEKKNLINQKQINSFDSFCQELCSLHKNCDLRYSLCNSAAIFNFSDKCYNLVRPGISMYGYSSISAEFSNQIDLRPVMTLCAEIISIKYLHKGSAIGYNHIHICEKDTLLGIVSIGYGDGYPLCFSDLSSVLIKGQKCQILGRISMDMMAVDLSECSSEVKIGDIVILWGGYNVENGQKNYLSAEEIIGNSNKGKMSVYNMLTNIQSRVKFYWYD